MLVHDAIVECFDVGARLQSLKESATAIHLVAHEDDDARLMC